MKTPVQILQEIAERESQEYWGGLMDNRLEQSQRELTVEAMEQYAQQQLTDLTAKHDAEKDKAVELIAMYQAYIQLLDKELTRVAVFLNVHGQGASMRDIEEGMRLRNKIEILLSQFRKGGEK